jgi:hypothetical protein
MRKIIKSITKALMHYTKTPYIVERKTLKTGVETLIWSDNTITVND